MLLGHFALASTIYVLLSPSLSQLAAAVALDASAGLLLWFSLGRIFLMLYPEETRRAFRGASEDSFGALKNEERAQVLEAFATLPAKAGRLMFLASFARAFPAFVLITLTWTFPPSPLARAAIQLAIGLMVFTYVYGVVLLECHGFLSGLTARLHERFDLSEAFLRVRVPSPKRALVDPELLLLSLIISFTLALQMTVIMTGGQRMHSALAIDVILIGVTGIALLLRIWQLGRSYIVSGFEGIFRQMDQLDYQKGLRQIPLHTYPLVARPQRSFNLLIRRLWISEQELASLARHEAEKSRYQVLGEMSARLAHDLSGPLHVARFCVNELADQVDPERRKTYLNHLSANVQKAADLVTSLRARLKNPEENPVGVTYFDAHVHVLRLLEAQFAPKEFLQVAIDLDPAVRDLSFRIQRVDLIQILDNLYRNSIQNLLSNRIPSPQLRISLLERESSRAVMLLSDNGTGLSKEKYEEMTLNFGSSAQSPGHLGLRLTRRLVETHGGSLSLYEPLSETPQRNGTTYCLTLRTVPDQGKGDQP